MALADRTLYQFGAVLQVTVNTKEFSTEYILAKSAPPFGEKR